MNKEKYIPLIKLSKCYHVEMSFFNDLNEIGLIEILTFDQNECIHQENLTNLEKIMRLHHELELNLQGIDIVMNLLQRIDQLQAELSASKSKLRFYEK